MGEADTIPHQRYYGKEPPRRTRGFGQGKVLIQLFGKEAGKEAGRYCCIWGYSSIDSTSSWGNTHEQTKSMYGYVHFHVPLYVFYSFRRPCPSAASNRFTSPSNSLNCFHAVFSESALSRAQ